MTRKPKTLGQLTHAQLLRKAREMEVEVAGLRSQQTEDMRQIEELRTKVSDLGHESDKYWNDALGEKRLKERAQALNEALKNEVAGCNDMLRDLRYRICALEATIIEQAIRFTRT